LNPGTGNLWVPPRQSRGVSHVYARVRILNGLIQNDLPIQETRSTRRRLEGTLADGGHATDPNGDRLGQDQRGRLTAAQHVTQRTL